MWPSDPISVLQDSFQFTEVERGGAVTSPNILPIVTTTETKTIYQIQKLWLNAEVRSLLKDRDATFCRLQPLGCVGNVWMKPYLGDKTSWLHAVWTSFF